MQRSMQLLRAVADRAVAHLFTLGICIRLVLILYGSWQDENFAVKYTDVDYRVFTDAARHIVNGDSPYDRPTYRYTPLLALLLTPNILVHEAFGKVLFSACDIAVGVVILEILRLRNLGRHARYYCALWVLNPLSITISTRGNADSLVCLLLHLTLYFLLRRRTSVAAICFGLAVHFRVFPIFFAPTILLYLNDAYTLDTSGRWRVFQAIYEKIRFGAVSFSLFVVLGAGCLWVYGSSFLYHTYLYHLIRQDNRHNFSVYFYMIYLNTAGFDGPGIGLQFWPSIITQLFISVSFFSDLSFAMFLQSMAFVTLNKVCTSQYFLWYVTFLPLVLPRTSIGWKKGLVLAVSWTLGQAIWLWFAYRLEFLGENTFVSIWLASLLFFAINIWVTVTFATSYKADYMQIKTS